MWTWVRLAGGAAVLALLAAKLGTDPFVEALHKTSLAAIAFAVVVTALTTVCCAWRWRLVAAGLGLDVPLRRAVSACYGAYFLNITLPGGVLGEVHRAVDFGRRSGEMSRTVRSVAWERVLGQAAQVVLTVGLLLVLPSPLGQQLPAVAALVLVAGIGAVLLLRGRRRRETGRRARVLLAAARDLSLIMRPPRVAMGIALASVLVVLGHVSVFLVAVRTAGTSVSMAEAFPLALVVLLGAALPLNIAGWGPREGTAAWAFAVAGLGAAQGVTVSVVYGVMALVATLPGALMIGLMRHPGARVVARA